MRPRRGPDEAGHQGSLPDKLRAIEDFDSLVVGRILEGAKRALGDFNLLVLPDHYTPVELKTHTSEPVPFVLLYKFTAGEGNGEGKKERPFTEKAAASRALLWKTPISFPKSFLANISLKTLRFFLDTSFFYDIIKRFRLFCRTCFFEGSAGKVAGFLFFEVDFFKGA